MRIGALGGNSPKSNLTVQTSQLNKDNNKENKKKSELATSSKLSSKKRQQSNDQ